MLLTVHHTSGLDRHYSTSLLSVFADGISGVDVGGS